MTMATPPFFRVSGLSLSPQLPGERTIAADPKTGEMVFADPVVGSLRLAEMRGLRGIPGTVTAGPGGDYASISAAVAAAVAATDPRSGLPASVTLMPGITAEGILVPKESWVQIAAVGRAQVVSPGGPALIVEGGNRPTRLELRGVDLTCAGASSALAVVGGTGGVVLEAEACRLESRDPRASAVTSEGLADIALLRCDVRALGGSAALSIVGQADARVEACNLRGGMTASTTGKWLLDRSWIEGPCIAEAKSASPARFWGSRLEGGGLLLGGPCEIVGCDVQYLELADGAQVDASLSKLRQVSPTTKAWLSVDRLAGDAAFMGSDTLTVIFDVPRISDVYEVVLMLRDRPAGDEVPWLSRREKEGFEVQFLSRQSVQVGWVVSSL